MKILTTPMCEDVLRIAGLTNYDVVKPDSLKNADLAIVYGEIESDIPKLSLKLNTYTQIYDSIMKIREKFDTTPNHDMIKLLTDCIKINSDNREKHGNIKVKVYSTFLTEIVRDMGFNVTSEDYDYIVCPDYLKQDIEENERLIIIPSHKNVSTNIIERIDERYTILERELCMKQ